MISKLRRSFSIEWTWRMFIALQVLGIILTFVMDISDRNWDVFPGLHRYDSWSFTEGMYWGGGRPYGKGYQNWFLLLFLFGPFIVSKTIDWILSGKDSGN